MKKLMNLIQAHEEEKSSLRFSHQNLQKSEEEKALNNDVFEDEYLKLRFEKRYGILPSDPQVRNQYKKYEFMESQFKNEHCDYNAYFKQQKEQLKQATR